MEYSKITEDIYVGMQPNQALKAELEALGITASINLRAEFDDAAHGLAFPGYCYLPTVDFTAPTLAHLQQGVSFIQQNLAAGGKVYIHCAAGVGRAPTMGAAYLISQGKTVADSLAWLKRQRPVIDLDKAQITVLYEFAKTLT